MSLGVAGRIARRELRGGIRGFRVFLLCLALGVAAVFETSKLWLDGKHPDYTNLLIAAAGAALACAVGLGMLPSFDRVKQMVPARRTFAPDPQNRDVYDRQYAVFTQLYKNNRKAFAKLNT